MCDGHGLTYGTGLAGRQVHGEPLPDHGVQEYERSCGSFTKVHPEFYAESVKSRTFVRQNSGSSNILADVIPS